MPQRAHAVLAGEFRTQRGDLPVGQPVPFRLAQQGFASASARRWTSSPSSTISAIWSTNHGSMPVASASSSTLAPARSARSTA